MQSIDEKIKQALDEEFNDIIQQNENTDANPFKQMKQSFQEKMKWTYIFVTFFSALFFFFMLYSIYQFYYEQETKALIGWAISIIVFAFISQIGKIWYWSEIGRNRVIREIKLLELQIAYLLEKSKSE